MITIERLKNKDKKLFFLFLNKNWKNNYFLTKNKKLFNWQFQNLSSYNFFIAKQNKKIISCLGYIHDGHYDKKIKKINDRYWLVNWLTLKHSGYAGILLLNYFIKKIKPNFVGTLGCSLVAKKIFKILNFNIGQLNFGFTSRFNKNSKILIHQNKTPLKKKINKKIKIYKIQRASDIKDSGKLKSRIYILNRYLSHPIYKYYIFNVYKKKKYLGYVVARIESYKSSQIMKIIDFNLVNVIFLKDVMHLLLDYANIEYCSLYYYFVNSKLKLKLQSYSKKIIVPNYFKPFQKKNIKINFAYKVYKKKIKNNFFVLGDCDQDRP